MSSEKRRQKSKTQKEDGILKIQGVLLTWIAEDVGLFPKISRWLQPDDFFEEPYHTIAGMLYEQARTGEISPAQIISYFESKEDLLAKTFEREDKLFLDMILDNFPVLSYESIDYEVRCRLLFMRCWKYVTGRPSELKFYMRYYHSLMYNTYSFENHTKQYSILVDKLRSAFPAEGGYIRCIK
mgnify:CR=1 FL=1